MDNKKKRSIPKPTYFGTNLKFLRRLAGMSQSELAKALILTRNKIASYESGIVEPNAELFIEVCNFFKVIPREMLNTILTNNLGENINLNLPSKDVNEKLQLESIEQFIAKTNEMSKIMNGYKALIELKQSQEQRPELKSLNHSFEELINLFEMLIMTNWEIINELVTIENES
ncbi:MAG: helix-turn-helix transcriptional regulator [Saprospiraceae bacterium]|nr:helix-turn-helix domain-containing protein [Bacteroidia bacterium]NNE14604.1 helix-turn-helix transcriptional regulator [Saprospiraceae bacterium]NNL92507.1 helix-turn-helix transcriptional regulator [Saprospiraceae bacterium]